MLFVLTEVFFIHIQILFPPTAQS